jgi:hypothetical protein
VSDKQAHQYGKYQYRQENADSNGNCSMPTLAPPNILRERDLLGGKDTNPELRVH